MYATSRDPHQVKRGHTYIFLGCLTEVGKRPSICILTYVHSISVTPKEHESKHNIGKKNVVCLDS